MFSKSAAEPILSKLRGNHTSVRRRFLYNPVNYSRYFLLYKLFGRSWIDYYTAYKDDPSYASVNKVPPMKYMNGGLKMAEYLIHNGLKPDDRLLDYGCGVGRLAYGLKDYLLPGRYVGVDISAGRLAKGTNSLTALGVPKDFYAFIPVKDYKLKELGNRQFDFIWAQSVATHLPKDDIREMLRGLKPYLAENGRFMFNFAVAERAVRRNVKDFWYTKDEMLSLCRAEGYRVEVVEEWRPHISDNCMLSLRHG